MLVDYVVMRVVNRGGTRRALELLEEDRSIGGGVDRGSVKIGNIVF